MSNLIANRKDICPCPEHKIQPILVGSKDGTRHYTLECPEKECYFFTEFKPDLEEVVRAWNVNIQNLKTSEDRE